MKLFNLFKKERRSKYLTQQQIYDVLVEAKRLFIKYRVEGRYSGMCVAIQESLFFNGRGLVGYPYFKEYIPKFNRTWCRGYKSFRGHWWAIEDTASRIKAFDKLIKYYKP